MQKVTVYLSFKDNICGADVAYMQLISKYKKEFHFYYVFLIISCKHAWVAPLTDKEEITITDAFQKILEEFDFRVAKSEGCKANISELNKIWVYTGSEFTNRSVTSWSQDCDIEIYSTHNKRKSVVEGRFFRTLKKQNLQIYDRICEFNIKKYVC